MTSSVRVLSVHSIDSSPSLLLVGPDGRKTLVNCGEGCQRIFLEFGQKISSVDRICLTHLDHDAMGGLPGMILTAADVSKTVTAAAAARKNLKMNKADGPNNNTQQRPRPISDDSSIVRPGLQVFGPSGLKAFVHSLRHFMRRDDFRMEIHEGTYRQEKVNGNKKKRKTAESLPDEPWFLESIVTNIMDDSSNSNGRQQHRQAISYLFTTPPVQGRFLADKAKELGIPKGPLYGKLKSGQSVTFPDPKDPEHSTITVESHQVVEPQSPGIVTAVLYYPTEHVWQQLLKSEQLQPFQQSTENSNQRKEDKPILEVVVHMAPPDLFHTVGNESCRRLFGKDVQHLLLATGKDGGGTTPNISTFQCSAVGSWMRSQLSPAIYHRPKECSIESKTNPTSGFNLAMPLLEYVVIPRAKRGFQGFDNFSQHCKHLQDDAQNMLSKSGCLDEISRLQQSMPLQDGEGTCHSSCESEILFTGTGSAIPCKYRNVSGIHVRMNNGKAMLLDCGEGTVGQVLRAQESKEDGLGLESPDVLSRLNRIMAVWISHPHADHHLGLLRLLSEKGKSLPKDPLILIAPPNLNRFLQEYEQIVPSVAGTYTFLDCRSLTLNASFSFSENLHNVQQRLQSELGITSCNAIPVSHCQNSFAVVFHGTSFGSLAYSGDCRPSMAFADVAQNADLLIHEATFADGLEADAALKRHCTVGEALKVAHKMKAKTLLLTHFSQRYPKIPPLPASDGQMTIVPAFDFMTITKDNVSLASQMTPILRLLYPDEDKSDEDDEINTSVIETPMDIPGLFAQKELL